MSSRYTVFSNDIERIPNAECKSQFINCHCHEDPLQVKVLKNANEMPEHFGEIFLLLDKTALADKGLHEVFISI